MDSTSSSRRKFTPAVHIVWLHFMAGLVWLGVGLMLISFAAQWLKPVVISTQLLLIAAGLVAAVVIYLFGFSKLGKKNIKRINGMQGRKVCLFAFIQWKGYLIVAFMVSLGIYLRVYSPIPKPLLAILYLGIGGGLLTSSLHYFMECLNHWRGRE